MLITYFWELGTLKKKFLKKPHSIKNKIKKKIKKWKEVAKTALNKKKVLVIPHIDDNTKEFDMGDEAELGEESFICIPIILTEQKIGTISVNCPFKSGELLHRTVKLLSIISLILSLKYTTLLQIQLILLNTTKHIQ